MSSYAKTLSNFSALGNDHNTVYYIGNDGTIWYYFNDRDHGSYTSQIGSANQVINENWYQSQIRTTFQAYGSIAIDPVGLGRLFWMNVADNALYMIDWTNGDIPVDCSMAFAPDGIAYFGDTYKTDSNDVAKLYKDSSSELQISAYPNPSNGDFTFIVTGVNQSGNIDVIIQDISGEKICELNKQLEPGTNSSFEWNANTLTNGIYIYKAKLDSGEILTGKLVKM